MTKYLPDGDPRWENVPNSTLVTQFKSLNKSFFVINTHGAWSPKAVDTPEKMRQGKILYEYIKKLRAPFILAGDLNLTKDTIVIKNYQSLSANLIDRYNVMNTLNPRLHYAKELFPKGLAVDYIFTSPEIRVKKFKVIDDIDLSDHLGLKLKFEV